MTRPDRAVSPPRDQAMYQGVQFPPVLAHPLSTSGAPRIRYAGVLRRAKYCWESPASPGLHQRELTWRGGKWAPADADPRIVPTSSHVERLRIPALVRWAPEVVGARAMSTSVTTNGLMLVHSSPRVVTFFD